MIRWQVILMVVGCLMQSTLSDTMKSDLDVAECASAHITHNIVISPNHPRVTARRNARTEIECLMRCNDNNDCSGVYQDGAGSCYEFDGDIGNIETLSPDIGMPTGDLMTTLLIGETSNCGGVDCGDNDYICLKGCGNENFDNPMCTADSRGNCDVKQEYTNARHYWSPAQSDSRDSGTVMYVTYPKIRSDSGLRVMIHMSFRGHANSPGYCNHWYLTFDGDRCTNPDTIEMLDYSATTGNFHRAGDIDGICYGLERGDRRIDLVIDPCDGYGSTDGYAGWNSARTMLIMEIIPRNKTVNVDKQCPNAAVFNHQYASWNEEMDVTFYTNSESRVVKSFNYKKLADDTSLRIKYNALIALIVDSSSHTYCGRWFISIDGNECSPKADILIHQSTPDQYTYWRDHRRVRTVEGICDNNLPAGEYSIEVNVGQCISHYTEPTHFISGGFGSPSRLHIEEVRLLHKADAVFSAGKSVYKSMTGYLAREEWYGMNKGDDNDVLQTFTYVKQYSDTGLRLTATGSHRTIYNGGYSPCGRWYFLIDGSNCGNPGYIEGVSYFNYYTNVYQPMQVSGICHGIAAGSRSIQYRVGTCSGYNPTEAYTGWQSSFQIFVEELRVDLVKTCSGNPVNCGP